MSTDSPQIPDDETRARPATAPKTVPQSEYAGEHGRRLHAEQSQPRGGNSPGA